MNEDGEQDAVHGGTVLEHAHGAGAASDLAEPAFDGVCGAHGFSLLVCLVLEAGEQLVEVVAQAIDGLGVVSHQRSAKRRAAARALITVAAFMTSWRPALTSA